jgi:ADP-dependent NAD(P)H-hydrate dehydratase / NAD(P)H-hydrate epimerase
MKLLRARDVAALDAAAEAAGLGPDLLMGRAGRAVADTALRLQPQATQVVVLTGPGNNGGDGYVAAAELIRRGLTVGLLEMTTEPRTPTARHAREALLELAPAVPCAAALVPDDEEAAALLDGADLVIDALLGAGRGRPAGPELSALFGRVRASGVPILAVDVPSGLDADRATIDGDVLTATWTLQLSAAKPASLLPPARDRYGAWWVDDLGLPEELVARHAVADAIGRTRAGRVLPRRRSDAHKYRAGAVLVVGGSPRYAGAAELAARAALRAGAGYVTLAARPRHPASWPELVALDWDGAEATALAQAKADVAVVGPGLEADDQALRDVLNAWGARPLVLDGGALRREAWPPAAADAVRVLTPHAAEAGALLGRAAVEVAADPLAAAAELASATGAWVVLKGPATAVADPTGRLRLVAGGPAALAVAGTGDVLAGVIGALWAARLADQRAGSRAGGDLLELLAAAVVLHAEAARIALSRLADGDAVPTGGLIASDVVAALPAARGRIEADHQRS